jgi:hypothetical protein
MANAVRMEIHKYAHIPAHADDMWGLITDAHRVDPTAHPWAHRLE